MKKYLFNLAIAFLGALAIIGQAWAGDVTITGRVRGNDNKAFKGATVTASKLVIGTTGITAQVPLAATDKTGDGGNYQLQIKDSDFGQPLANSMSVETTASRPSGAPSSAKLASKEFIVKRDVATATAPEITLNMPGGGETLPAGADAPANPTGTNRRGANTSGNPSSQSSTANAPFPKPFVKLEGEDISKKAPTNEINTLSDRLNPNKHPQGDSIATIWRALLNITNAIVILFFIAIGFATIFHMQVDTYGIKKTLPTVIIAIILANFSLFITRMVLDLSNIVIVSIVNSQPGGTKGFVEELVKAFINGGTNTLSSLADGFKSAGNINIWLTAVRDIIAVGTILTAGGYLALGAVVIAALGLLIPTIFILILAILFYVRAYVILALAAVSPLAFIAFALPATQPLFKQWWTQLTRWAFMGPVAFFMLWLAIQFKNAFSDNFEFGIYLITLTMLYLAISLPFKMGGAITANVGKYIQKPLRQAAGFGAKWYGRTSDVISGSISSKIPGSGGRPITVGGLYRGWSANADRSYQRHVARTTGAGEDIREAVASAASGMLRPTELPARLKRAGQILKKGERYQQAVEKEQTSEAQKIAGMPEHFVNEGLQEAIRGKDHTKASQYLIAKALQGENVQDDLHAITSQGLHKNPEMRAAMKKAQAVAIDNGKPVINPADKDPEYQAKQLMKQRVMKKGLQEQKKIALDWAREPDSTDPSHKLMAEIIQEMGKGVRDMPEVAAALGKLSIPGYVQEITIDDQAVQRAEQAINQAIVDQHLINFQVEFGVNDPSTPIDNRAYSALTALQNRRATLPADLQTDADKLLNAFRPQMENAKNNPLINEAIRNIQPGNFSSATPITGPAMRAGEIFQDAEIYQRVTVNAKQAKQDAMRQIRNLNADIGREIERNNTLDYNVHYNLRARIDNLSNVNQVTKQKLKEHLDTLRDADRLMRASQQAKERVEQSHKQTKRTIET